MKHSLSRMFAWLALVSVALGVLAFSPGRIHAATPKPSGKPTATAPPTPKALPKSIFPLNFNGKTASIKGFTIYGTPSPAPTASPAPKPGAKKTPKPMKFASVETITQIDSYCGGADAGSVTHYQFGGAIALRTPPAPCAQPCNSHMKALSGVGSTCPIVFVSAKDFFKLLGAKVTTLTTPPPIPDGELTAMFPTPNPSASPTATPPVPVPTPYQPLAMYYTGSYTIKYCKKLYSGPFFMNKLTMDGGKPYIDPFGLLNAINADTDKTNLKGLSDFTYRMMMPPIGSVIQAGKISGSYQPGPTVTITGPSQCKAKPHKHGAYEVEMTSSITTQTHDSQTPATLVAVVKADFVLQKASGNAMVFKMPKKFQLPSTNVLASGTGTLTLASYSWTQTCDKKTGAQIQVQDPVNGTGRMMLLGTAKAPVLVFDTGLMTNSVPSVSAMCEGHGANTGPAIWAASFNAAHIGNVTAGGFFGGSIAVGYAIKLDPSVDAGVFTANYNQSVNAGTTSVNESTTFTVTKL